MTTRTCVKQNKTKNNNNNKTKTDVDADTYKFSFSSWKIDTASFWAYWVTIKTLLTSSWPLTEPILGKKGRQSQRNEAWDCYLTLKECAHMWTCIHTHLCKQRQTHTLSVTNIRHSLHASHYILFCDKNCIN